jgi:hypothetical protein
VLVGKLAAQLFWQLIQIDKLVEFGQGHVLDLFKGRMFQSIHKFQRFRVVVVVCYIVERDKGYEVITTL